MESMYKLLGIHKPSEKTKDNVDKSKKTDHEVLKGRFKIQKSDNDKHLAFGWASIAIDEAGEQLVDWQEDMIDPEDLENAAYAFVRIYREGGEMHERGDCAVLIESVVFTEEKWRRWEYPSEQFLSVGGSASLLQTKRSGEKVKRWDIHHVFNRRRGRKSGG